MEKAAGIPADRLWSTAIDTAGKIWFATDQNGIYRSRVPMTAAAMKQWETKAYKLSDRTTAKEVISPVFASVLPPPTV